MLDKRLSIVVPLFNESQAFGPLCEELASLRGQLADLGVDTELLLIDNSSTDETWDLLSSWTSEQEPGHAVAIRHPVNLGMQQSLLTGIKAASGGAVLVLQADLQDPPAVALVMVQQWMAGAKLVVGRIRRREGRIRERLGTWAFYILLRFLSGRHVIANSSDFYVIDRSLVPEVIMRSGTVPFIRTTLQSIRTPDSVIEYDRFARKSGKPGSMSWRIRFGVDALVQDLSALCTRLGMLSASLTLIALLGLVGLVLAYVLGYRSPVAGWLTFTLLLLVLIAFTSAFAAVVLLLLNRIYRDLPRTEWSRDSVILRS